MKCFTHTDGDDLGRARMGHFTNHFDLRMAVAIARKYAKPKVVTPDYVQPESPGFAPGFFLRSD